MSRWAIVLTSKQCAKESTDGQQADNQSLYASFEPACVIVVDVAAFCKAEQEILHKQDVGDLTGVIAKEESSCASMARRRECKASVMIFKHVVHHSSRCNALMATKKLGGKPS